LACWGEGAKGESKDPEDVSLCHVASGSSTKDVRATISAMREGRFYTFWVYIMASNTGTLYTGMTGFVDTRVSQHKSGEIDGFTKKYKCDRLVYYEQYDDVYVAKRRERQLKGWRREKKIALIEKINPRWEDLSEHWGREMRFKGQPIKESPAKPRKQE
jgi:putative endonuclease